MAWAPAQALQQSLDEAIMVAPPTKVHVPYFAKRAFPGVSIMPTETYMSMQLSIASEVKQKGGGAKGGSCGDVAAGVLETNEELFNTLHRVAELEEALDAALKDNERLQAELIELHDKRDAGKLSAGGLYPRSFVPLIRVW